MNIFSYEMLFAGGGGKEFIRPNLTANGTLGGNAFAVGGTQALSRYPLYYAVDSSTSTYWMSGSSGYYIFYNPKPLNVTKLVLTCSSTSYMPNPNNLVVQGSNDNSSYTAVTITRISGTGSALTLNLSNTAYYNYYRLTLRPVNSQVMLTDLAITATYKG